MNFNGWEDWLMSNDQHAFNQFSDLPGTSGAYDEAMLDSELTEFTDANNTNDVLASGNHHSQQPLGYPMAIEPGLAPVTFDGIGASHCNDPMLLQAGHVPSDPFTQPTMVQQTFKPNMPATTAYGTYPDKNVTTGQTWTSNPYFMTNDSILVNSPLPMQQSLSPGLNQYTPTTPHNSSRSDRSPTTPGVRRTTRFNTKQRDILQAWYDEHRNDTYASQEDLALLQRSTGLDARQVRAWLSRARRKEPIVPHRHLTVNVLSKTRPVTAVSEVSAAGTIVNAPTELTTEHIGDDFMNSMEVVLSSTRASSKARNLEDTDGWTIDDETPVFVVNTLAASQDDVFGWWMDSLPYDNWEDPEPRGLEPLISPHIIPHPSRKDTTEAEDRTAAKRLTRLRTEHDDGSDGSRLIPTELYDQNLLSPNHAFQNMDESRDNSASSEYSRSYLGSSNATRESEYSCQTAHSPYSLPSHESRKGRRRMQKQRLSGSGKSDLSVGGTNTCPVCGTEFSCKSSCKRHIQSVHSPSIVWVCGPITPMTSNQEGSDPDGLSSPCCFCSQQDCHHRLGECWSKPVEQRTFFRQDNFKQHLVGTHKVDADLVKGLSLHPWKRAHPAPPHTIQA